MDKRPVFTPHYVKEGQCVLEALGQTAKKEEERVRAKTNQIEQLRNLGSALYTINTLEYSVDTEEDLVLKISISKSKETSDNLRIAQDIEFKGDKVNKVLSHIRPSVERWLRQKIDHADSTDENVRWARKRLKNETNS